MTIPLLTSEIRTESDVVFVRQRARHIAALLSFDPHEQTRIATAVSEIARNAFLYALGGRVEFMISGPPEHFLIRISDRGQGIAHLPAILAGNYKSATGLGLGLRGSRKLMDTFRADTMTGTGTSVELGKLLPPRAPRITPQLLAVFSDELARFAPASPLEEVARQNVDLLSAFDELRSRQLELDRMYRELEDTSKSERAARAEAEAAVATRDELLAIVSHDLRNPLSVIVGSASLLQQTTIDATQHERVHKSTRVILRSADRMSRLIADRGRSPGRFRSLHPPGFRDCSKG